MTDDWLVKLDSVGRRFDSRWIFRDVNATIAARGVFAITGPSGIGKTTLSRLALRLDRPSEGTVKHARELAISVQFAEDRLLPELTVDQNLAYVGLDPSQLLPLADRLGIADAMGAYPGELSSGMRRRASFIRAIAHRADVVLLDEPFKGVDGPLRIALAREIRRLSAQMAVILIDHDLAIVSDLADTVLPLD